MSSHHVIGHLKTETPIIKESKGLPIFWLVLKNAVTIVWRIITIFWYWLERFILLTLLVGLTVGLAWWLSQKPSLLRDWEEMDKKLPTIAWSGDSVKISGIRDFKWLSEDEFKANYIDETYELKSLEKVYYIITPFSDHDGPAHTMLSFSFSGGKNIVISAELRKEKGESFDPIRGVLNQYELSYLIATEEDVIKLRTNFRKNEVYMYPINTSKEKVQELFQSMLIRANKLVHEPEFYNTLWNNCTTSVLFHANALRIDKLKGGMYTLFPSHSDELLFQNNLIDTKLPLGKIRKFYRIDEIARSYSGDKTFSEIIRSH